MGVDGAGDWDLRVYLDGNLVGMHNIMLAPSVRERVERLSGERSVQQQEGRDRYSSFDVIEEEPQEIPPSLQDLLAGEGNAPNKRRTTTATRRRS